MRVFSAACLTKTAMTGLHRHGVFDVPRNVTASIPPTLAGRGGSVSRRDRDHNPLTEPRVQLAWGRKSGGAAPPIPSYSSGVGGLGGEALLLEKRPLPPVVPHPALREGARGRGFSHLSLFVKIHLFELFAGDEDLAWLRSGGGADDAATGHLVN